jgi:protein-S-isoprenylcysteine O-methyltransferase Ste14
MIRDVLEESRMPERNLGIGMHALLGLLGVVAVVTGGSVGATQLRIATRDWPNGSSIVVATFCIVVLLGGALLIRAAMTGRVVVRRTRNPRTSK